MSLQKPSRLDLTALPHSVLSRILETLDPKTVATLARTNKLLRLFCLEEPLWMVMVLKSISAVPNFEWKGTWFKTFLSIEAYKRDATRTKNEMDGFRTIPPPKGFQSDFLYCRWYRSHLDVSQFIPENAKTLQRTDGRDLTLSEFATQFENPCRPALLTNLPEFQSGNASAQRNVLKAFLALKWNEKALLDAYGDTSFKIYHALDTFQIKLSTFLNYSKSQWDENAMYLFEPDVDIKIPEVLKSMQIPSIFSNAVQPIEDEWPYHQWMLIGSERSGTVFHIDPWASSAYILSIEGRKRWAFYPPNQKPPGISNSNGSGDEHITALQWFLEVLPQLKEEERPIEFVQNAGEAVYIPCGWWHCVLNLELTISFTTNFVSYANLEEAFRHLGKKETTSDSETQKSPSLPILKGYWVGFLAKAVWNQRLDLRAQLVTLAEKYIYFREYFQSLSEICSRHELPSPSTFDVFPIRATSNLIFKVDPFIIKIYIDQNPLNQCIQQLAESHALSLSSTIREKEDYGFGSLVGKGVVIIPMENGERSIEASYIVTNVRPGKPSEIVFRRLDEEQRKEWIQELGTVVAAFHSVSKTSSATNGSRCQSGQKCKSLQKSISNEDQTIAFGDMKSCLDGLESIVSSNKAYFQAQDPDRVWSQLAGGLISWKRSNETSPSRFSFKIVSETFNEDEWDPFLAFLEWRRKEVLSNPSETCLPNHLVSQLRAYLPTNVEDLIPKTLVSQKGRPSPVLIHGDLTNDNILIDMKGQKAKPEIVDFGDAGFGDPLYDFVAMGLCTLEGKDEYISLFAKSYLNHFEQETKGFPGRIWKERKHSVSYTLMCYSILHEDGVLDWLFERYPHYSEFQTLDEMEQAVWGELNSILKT